MEDITTYETYEDPYALVDSSDGSQIEPTDTATSESDTVIPEDDASSTDRPSTPNLSPIYVPSTQVMTSQRTILPLYPDHPDDVDLYRVQNLEDALISVPLQEPTSSARRSHRSGQPIDYAKYHFYGKRQ